MLPQLKRLQRVPVYVVATAQVEADILQYRVLRHLRTEVMVTTIPYVPPGGVLEDRAVVLDQLTAKQIRRLAEADWVELIYLVPTQELAG